MGVLLLFIWMLIVASCGVIAARKGRSVLGWIGIGVLFSAFGLIAAFAADSLMRKCPYCAESVRKEASICPHCRKELVAATPAVQPAPAATRALVADDGVSIPSQPTTFDRVFPWAVGIPVGIFVLCLSLSLWLDPPAATTTAATVEQTAAPTESPDDTPAPPPVKVYTAQELYQMFHTNEIRANQAIGDEMVRFSGTVTEIEQSDFKKLPELMIDAGDGNSFQAVLKDTEINRAAALNKGDSVILHCDHVSMPLDVHADGCVLSLY